MRCDRTLDVVSIYNSVDFFINSYGIKQKKMSRRPTNIVSLSTWQDGVAMSWGKRNLGAKSAWEKDQKWNSGGGARHGGACLWSQCLGVGDGMATSRKSARSRKEALDQWGPHGEVISESKKLGWGDGLVHKVLQHNGLFHYQEHSFSKARHGNMHL